MLKLNILLQQKPLLRLKQATETGKSKKNKILYAKKNELFVSHFRKCIFECAHPDL